MKCPYPIFHLRSGSCATTDRKSSLISLSMSSSLKDLSSFYEIQLLKIHLENTSKGPECIVPKLEFSLYLFFMTFMYWFINFLRTRTCSCQNSPALLRVHSKCSVSLGDPRFSSKRRMNKESSSETYCVLQAADGVDELLHLFPPGTPSPILLTNAHCSLFSK